jgi:aldehyde:ferredoxin oxidoreductase
MAEAGTLPPELEYPEIVNKYTLPGKGETHKRASCFGHVVNAAGLCMFGCMVTPAPAVPQFLTLATGHDFTMGEVLEIGERIANLRIAFNLREGVQNAKEYRMPARTLGDPPLLGGPTQGITVDNSVQLRDYYEAMGWNPETGIPRRDVFHRLGLAFATEVTED